MLGRALPLFAAATVLAACSQPSPRTGPAVASPGPSAGVPGTSLEPAPLSPPVQSAGPVPPASPPLVALRPALRGVNWTRLPTGRRVVALTFDAGSGAQGVRSILNTLASRHVPATFFLTGRWAATYPELARRIASTAGNVVGNHTMTHTDLRTLSAAQVRGELDEAEHWLRTSTGKGSTRPIFRFPYGARDERSLTAVNDAGYASVLWTVDTLGWKGTAGGQTVDSVYSRALGAASPGEIILMHVGAADEGSTLDADALPRVIDELRRGGYGFVNLREFLPA